MNENENNPIIPEENEGNTNSLPQNGKTIRDDFAEVQPTAENTNSTEDSGESTQAFNWEYTESEAQTESDRDKSNESSDTLPDQAAADEQSENAADLNDQPDLSENKNQKNSALITASILSLASIVLLVGFCLCLMLGMLPARIAGGETTVNKVTINTTVNETPTPPNTEIAPGTLADFLHSVVVIKGSNASSTSTGTGVIFSSNGYIITNYHVIEGCDVISVELYGEATAMRATVVGYHAEDDVAVIKIDRTDLRPATFVDSDVVRYGETVYAIGTPEGTDFGWSVTEGIVSAPQRELMIYDNEGVLEKKIKVVQTDAPVNHGNSGGPLINVRGEVVGIVTLKRSNTAGMGFALPSDGVLIDVASIIEKGHANDVNSGITIPRPLLGITGVGVTANTYYKNTVTAQGTSIEVVDEAYADQNPQNTFYAAKTGVYVSATSAGSDAASHLLRGDIITEVNGNSVSTIYHVMAIVNKYNGGDSVTIKYYRAGQYYTATVTLRPAS